MQRKLKQEGQSGYKKRNVKRVRQCNMLSGGCAISILGGFQHPTG